MVLMRRLLGLALATSPLAAQASDSIPTHDTFVITSRALAEPRTILVHTPAGYAAARDRFPVLYMPDGGLDEDFPHVVNTIDSLIALRRIPPTIVVGIPNTLRRRDLTGPTLVASDSAIAPRVGGSVAFRRFIRTELMPEIRRRYRTTRETAIVGESLAGLFIVETLLLEPKLFQRYVALSPSLWWNGGALVQEARTLAPRVGQEVTVVLSAANEPGIADNSARLAALFRRFLPAATGFAYDPRPDLEHGTIYRQEGPAALALALGNRGGRDDGAEWQRASLRARCGLPALELRGVTDAWGPPDSVAGPDGEGTWTYRRGALRIDLAVGDGMVEEWHVRGTPSRRDEGRGWNFDRRDARKRVEQYLAAHPETPTTTVYALYRRCLQPGMTTAHVTATWGAPNRKETDLGNLHFIYGYGIEGQYTWVRFRGDSLIAFGENAGAYE